MNTNVNNTNKDELTSLCDKINGLIINYIQTKSLDNKLYKENYTYFLNSPICKDLLSQIKILKDDLYHKNGDEQNISIEINNPDNRFNCSDWLTGLDYSDNDDTTSDHFSIYKNNTKDENEENAAKAESSDLDSGYFGQRQCSRHTHNSMIENTENEESAAEAEESAAEAEEAAAEAEESEEAEEAAAEAEEAAAEAEESAAEAEEAAAEAEESAAEAEEAAAEAEESAAEAEESAAEAEESAAEAEESAAEAEESEAEAEESAAEAEESAAEAEESAAEAEESAAEAEESAAEAEESAAEAEESAAEAEESEEEESEEEEDIYEVMIANKNYYTNNEKNGDIYEILPDEDIGNIIGRFINGKTIWN